MKSTIKKTIAVFVLLSAFYQKSHAQSNYVESMTTYIFSRDSVNGFDEQAASAGALAGNFFGNEYKVFMYRAKRTYVNQKYGIQSITPKTLFQNSPSARPMPSNGGACNNEDFELVTSNLVAPAAVQGWTLQAGTNSNSCNPPQLTSTPGLYTVFAAATTDTRIPMTVSSYFSSGSNTSPAGNSFIRLNDGAAGAKAVRMSKSFIPTPSSALFQYAYIAVIEDGGHGCCDQPGFNIKVTITNTVTGTSTLLTCPNISISVPGAGCTFTIPAGGPSFSACTGNQAAGWSFSNWTTSALDLTQYINSMVQIDITVVDCNAGGHGAYFYFDSKCSPMVVTGNGQAFSAGTTSVTVPTCGALGATICATPGLGPYSWAGPNVPANYSVPSLTNTCFTATLSATYTLYMNPPGSCAPIGRVVQATITPAPLLLASVKQAGCGDSTAVITLTPSGSAANPSSITWSPNPLSLNSATTVGTYTIPASNFTNVVSVTASDPLGCLITQTLGILSAAPVPTFNLVNTTGSPSITCAVPTISLAVQTNYSYGTLNFFWANNSQTYTTQEIVVTTAGNYSVLITDPATNCKNNSVISIGVNTIAPLSTISPNFQNITCNTSAVTVSATANPSVNVTMKITSPYGGTATATSHTMVYSPACGIYTHVLVNDVNGCVTTKEFSVVCSQGFPTFNVSSAQNFTLGCSSKSCAVVNIVNGNTDPPGGPVTYTLIPPSSTSSTTPSGVLTTVSVYTVCTPGTYTVVTKDNATFCETRIPISILQNTQPPNISARIERTILDCNNPKVTLFGQTTTTNSVSYLWSFNGTPNSQQGDTIQVVNIPSSPTTTLVNTFTLAITEDNNTCRSTSVIPIYQNLFKPNASISSGGTSSITCKTNTIVLTNQSTTSIPPATGFLNNKPATASWVGPSPQQPLNNSTTYTASAVGIYTATITDQNNGCQSTATLVIIDNKNYPVLGTSTDSIVLDCGSQNMTLDPEVADKKDLIYLWTTPSTASINSVSAATLTTNRPGEYAVVVTNSVNGCSTKRNMTLINGKLTADFESDKITGFAPLTVNFTNSSTSSNTLTGTSNIATVWNFGNGSSASYSAATDQVTSALFNQAGTYTVTLYASKGVCLESKQRVITVEIPSKMEIPNVFTPNNDGVNDFFFLKSANLTKIHAVIIDRWGKTVYELTSETGNISWDGKNAAGKDVAEGTYFYIIKASGSDTQEFNTKGTLSIYR
ncbi:hypothetical protein CNR22_07315 [Sphingobacteriaceae bacterium]|nr:hypothetical protein CNR22_07315 [Sphingobacteriaceae bacterium]